MVYSSNMDSQTTKQSNQVPQQKVDDDSESISLDKKNNKNILASFGAWGLKKSDLNRFPNITKSSWHTTYYQHITRNCLLVVDPIHENRKNLHEVIGLIYNRFTATHKLSLSFTKKKPYRFTKCQAKIPLYSHRKPLMHKQKRTHIRCGC